MVPRPFLGEETFYEHVHFNFNGSYRLARAWAEQVQRFLPEPVKDHAAGDWTSQETCERLVGIDGLEPQPGDSVRRSSDCSSHP